MPTSVCGSSLHLLNTSAIETRITICFSQPSVQDCHTCPAAGLITTQPQVFMQFSQTIFSQALQLPIRYPTSNTFAIITDCTIFYGHAALTVIFAAANAET